MENAQWPEDGTFPKVSKGAQRKLEIDKPRWDKWHGDMRKRQFLRSVRNVTAKMGLLPKKS